MSEQLVAPTQRIFIPNIFRNVQFTDELQNTVAQGVQEFGSAFISTPQAALKHDIITPREIDELRQRPSSSCLATLLRSCVLPNKAQLIDVIPIKVSLFSPSGQATRKGYNVLVDFERKPELDKDRAVIEHIIGDNARQQEPYRPQVLLGKLFQSPGKKGEIEEFFKNLLPSVLWLGPVEIV